MDTLNHVGDDK